MAAAVRGRKRRCACNLLQKLAESFISPVFETSEGCKILQNIAIPDRSRAYQRLTG
jgi:hypothetical protein